MEKPASELQVRKPDMVLARPVPRPREIPQTPHHQSSFTRADLLSALFKHKWKIVLGAVIGLLAAGGAYLAYPKAYVSEAKLLVRYVVERSTVDAVDTTKGAAGYAPMSDTVIGSELEILSSWDLAVQTAEAIGPKRLLPDYKGTPSKEAAAATIASGLQLGVRKGSNIILVSYKNSRPELTTLVLNELVNRYFNKHLEVHRSAGAFDFVTQQTDQVRARLNQTEDALKDVKQKAGIISLDNSTEALSQEAGKVEDQLHAAQADLAEEEARLRQIRHSTGGVTVMGDDETEASPSPSEGSKSEPGQGPKSEEATKPKSEQGKEPKSEQDKKTVAADKTKAEAAAKEVPDEIAQKYDALSAGLDKLRKKQTDLFARYTPQSRRVRTNAADIDRTIREMRDLEKQYPSLETKAAPAGSPSDRELDPAAEAARLAGLKAKKEALAARLKEIRQKMQDLAQVAPQVNDLERQRELEEANYKYFEATLEKARVDEALDPSKIPNISAVQRPSPPSLDTGKRNRVVTFLALSGLGISIALVLFKELILDRAIRRPADVEKFVGINVLMSIPYSYQPNGNATANSNGNTKAIVPADSVRNIIAPWDTGHFIRPYSEAIRDRLGLYFELNNLTHKPKLVGVAGFSEKSGTSTLAAGLASALSETGDGKVLLVDVNLGPDQVHPFFKGKPAYALKVALKPSGPIDSAAENLYLATVGGSNAGPAQLGLKKFFDMMPNLKASDFDYIIFDMPALDQTSPTWGMAAFMDKMLVVVESEGNSRDVVQRGYKALVHERDNVSIVLNKVRSYTPKKLELVS